MEMVPPIIPPCVLFPFFFVEILIITAHKSSMTTINRSELSTGDICGSVINW